MTATSAKFRYDINALRAIAVIGVLLFHFKVPYFNGGFSGVDIFFVISGYLMTRIIINGIENNKFSVVEFYGKRLKRIVPALLVLIIVLSCLGFFFYFPVDFMLNEKNATASILFLSNMFYWKNSGYFDPSSETNILLHTWSLSVEWQFYLVYPVVLLIILKLFKTKSRFTGFFVASTFLIMLFSIYLTKKSPTASFYLLPSRSWEMMFGGIAFLLEGFLKDVRVRKLISLLGYILLLAGLCLLRTEMEWPGFFTIIPVVVTFLIITSNYNDFKFLKSSAVQFLGKISYSLYLWHWPVYVVSKYFGVETTWVSVFSLLAVSFILGYLSYRYVESINFKNNTFILSGMIGLIAITCYLGFVSTNSFMFKPLSIYLTNYESEKVDKKSQFSSGCCFMSSLHSGMKDFKKMECLSIKEDKKNILLIGDSHAAQLSLSLRNVLGQYNINLLQATSSGCSPIKRMNGQLRCSEIMDYIYNDFIVNNSKKIDGIFICANWVGRAAGDNDRMVNDIRNTIQYLNELGIPVLLIGQNETYYMRYASILAKEIEYNIKLRDSQINKDSFTINQILEDQFKSNYINIIHSTNIPPLSKTNSPYMFDENHFTLYGADIAIKKVFSDPITISFLKKMDVKENILYNSSMAFVSGQFPTISN
ncbi:acyltransferase family protein [Pedobacter sp. AW31-3R]|uniref:acyltransferase family protein n=1 Tax=Pedobacter sp. AW31-3R TaxID=3445781 RepID=UPI003FA0D15F